MAWTAPRTWVASEVPTAAIMNAHIRDNFLELDSASFGSAGALKYADGANSMSTNVLPTDPSLAGHRLVAFATGVVGWVPSAYTVGDQLYQGVPAIFTDMDSPGWGGNPVEVVISTGTSAMVFYGARYVSHGTIGQNVQLTYRVAGATDIAGANTWGTATESDPAGTLNSVFRANYQTSLNEGVNTFVLQGLVSGTANLGNIGSPWIMVKAL